MRLPVSRSEQLPVSNAPVVRNFDSRLRCHPCRLTVPAAGHRPLGVADLADEKDTMPNSHSPDPDQSDPEDLCHRFHGLLRHVSVEQTLPAGLNMTQCGVDDYAALLCMEPEEMIRLMSRALHTRYSRLDCYLFLRQAPTLEEFSEWLSRGSRWNVSRECRAVDVPNRADVLRVIVQECRRAGVPVEADSLIRPLLMSYPHLPLHVFMAYPQLNPFVELRPQSGKFPIGCLVDVCAFSGIAGWMYYRAWDGLALAGAVIAAGVYAHLRNAVLHRREMYQVYGELTLREYSELVACRNSSPYGTSVQHENLPDRT